MANRFLASLSSTEVIGARGSNAQSDERNDGEGHNAAADKERYQHRGSRLSPGNLLRLRQPNDFKDELAATRLRRPPQSGIADSSDDPPRYKIVRKVVSKR